MYDMRGASPMTLSPSPMAPFLIMDDTDKDFVFALYTVSFNNVYTWHNSKVFSGLVDLRIPVNSNRSQRTQTTMTD